MEKRNKKETISFEGNKTKNKTSSPKINKNNLKIDELVKNKNHDLNLETIDECDEEIKELFDAFQNEKNNSTYLMKQFILPLFDKTNIKEFLKSDLLFTYLNINDLISFTMPYITLKKYDQYDLIYSYNEPAEFIYLILRGNIGLYHIVETEEMFTSDEYYYYLYCKYSQYKQILLKQFDESNNKNIYPN